MSGPVFGWLTFQRKKERSQVASTSMSRKGKERKQKNRKEKRKEKSDNLKTNEFSASKSGISLGLFTSFLFFLDNCWSVQEK